MKHHHLNLESAWLTALVVLLLSAATVGLSGCERKSEETPAPKAHGTTAATNGEVPGADGVSLQPVPLPAPKPTEPLPEGASCITAECHAVYETAHYIHGAVAPGDCSVCHSGDVGAHSYPLRREGNALCTYCHAVEGNREHQHDALQAPGCVACHDPHASETKFLLTADSLESLCLGCHVVESGNHPHSAFAAGECTVCHQPHESNYDKLLRGGDGAEHCLLCHEETRNALDNAIFVHAPAAEACTNCHNPHTSDYPPLLQEPLDEQCFSCHENVRGHLAAAKLPHAAVFIERGCANCHDAHATGVDHLLRASEDVLCLACHNQPVTSRDGRAIPDMTPEIRDRDYLHGPIRFGECSPCHDAHGADHDQLLRNDYTAEFFAPFGKLSYALCFDCHADAIVLTEETSELTNFRDGEINLHYLHVRTDRKGRTCRACHSIHGSDNPNHVADSVPFEGSQWLLPIRFEKTVEGGSCAPGCHAPESYSRDVADSATIAPTGGAP